MNKCKTCKWWRLSDNNDSITGAAFEIRYCENPLLLFYSQPEVPNGASMVDDSGYRTAPVTGPDFGCVNWEAEKL